MKGVESLRLGYKRMQEDSADFLRSYLSRSDTTRYLPLGKPYSSEQVDEYIAIRMQHWQKHNFGLFLLYLKTTDECIGYSGLEYVCDTEFVDLRFGLVIKHWGKGFAKEAVLTCIASGFTQLRLQAIYGVAVPDNIASAAVMLKAGLKEVENLHFYQEKLRYFRILREEWQKMIENGLIDV